MPPSYEYATKLPTYEEAERSKAEEAANGTATNGIVNPPPQYHLDTDGEVTSEVINKRS